MERSRQILLVEDNPDDAFLATRAFAKTSVPNRIVVAQDGEEALDYLFLTGPHAFRDRDKDPEVVLLDLNLPRINGIEVLRQIRADDRTRTLPVIMLTSSKEDADLQAAYALGANSFIRKPVDFSEFLVLANKIASYWLQLNQSSVRPPTPR